jgi:hypothetical protein
MVASWGWIIPEPFATPTNLISLFPSRQKDDASFVRLSVVKIACANWRRASSDAAREDMSSGNFATTLSAGRGTPIMPVDDGKTASAATPRSFPVSAHIRLHARKPGFPVAQLAFPELTMTARIRPLDAVTEVRPTSTGAATTRFWVKTAAAVVPTQASAKAKSGLPLTFMPEFAVEKVNPSGR